MLANVPIATMIPVRDISRAKDFYGSTLGLPPSSGPPHADGSVAFDLPAGGALVLLPDEDGSPSGRTVMSFNVGDVAREIPELEASGVTFEDYDDPDGLMTVDHIAAFEGEKAAWFQDSEGNMLCLHEDSA